MANGRPYLGLRGQRLIWTMILTIVAPAYFMAGYNNAVPGGLLTLDSFIATFPAIDTVNTTGAAQTEAARVQGTMVAIYLVGCLAGALSCMRLGDMFGRTRTIQIGAGVTVIGSIILCTSFSLAQLFVARIILGLGLGAMLATVPAWQAECSPAGHRGGLVVLEAAFATIGLAVSQFIDLGCYFSSTSFSWRFPWAFPLVLSFLILISIPFLPDSPRWLVKKGRVEEAMAIMAILDDEEPNSPRVQEEIHAMQSSLSIMGEGSFMGILRDKDNKIKLRTLLAMFSTFSQQMNGAGVIGFYTVSIFLELGLTPIVARVLAACVYVFQLPCCFGCYYLVDRVGRRWLLLFGAIGMGLVFVVLTGALSVPAGSNKACTVVAAIALFAYTFFFGISYGVNWLYPTEVAPLAFRTQIYALTTASQFGVNFMVVEVSPLGITHLGYRYFIIWGAICLFLITPVTYFFFPETTGHTLEDMDRIFRVATGPIDAVRVSKRVRHDATLHHAGVIEVTDLKVEALDHDNLQMEKEGAVHLEIAS